MIFYIQTQLCIYFSSLCVCVSHCCCCRPTPPCLFRAVLPYFEVKGRPVLVSSLGFKCLDCFIWNCSYFVYPSKMKGPFRDNCLRYFYTWLAGCVEGIRRALVLGHRAGSFSRSPVNHFSDWFTNIQWPMWCHPYKHTA